MDDPILQISKKRYCGDSTVISVRLPKDMLSDIDALAKYTGRSRNEIMQTCMEFAIRHMQITAEEN